jgi:hypothetical protein
MTTNNDRVTPKAQLAYQTLVRINLICQGLEEVQPEVIERYATRFWFVLVILNCIGRRIFGINWRDHVKEMRDRGCTPKDVAHRM